MTIVSINLCKESVLQKPRSHVDQLLDGLQELSMCDEHGATNIRMQEQGQEQEQEHSDGHTRM